ncbi:hypothetical protein Q5O89_15585 [Peribacillus frigoritolerans]|nr:hypothetical protein [Peribacillus frigoritolerans]
MQITKKVQSFSFIEFPMHSIYKSNANTYIESHLNKTIFEFKGNLFDINSLNRPVNLDCLNCHHAHNRLCCDGSPYPPLTRDIEKVVNIAEDIFKETLSNEAYEQIEGFIKDQGLVDENGSFTENCGKCVFFVENENIGAHVCAIHSFAINNKKTIPNLSQKVV